VNPERLGPNPSYDIPEYVERGYYVDLPFHCKDCGAEQVWRATQQKWWYETAKGDPWSTAVRCRACRRKEQRRKAEAREVHLAGIAARERRDA
jgi:ribosomal protein L40E